MWQKELNSIVQGAASKAWTECTCWLMCKVLVFVISSGDRQALCWGFSYASYVLIVVVRLEPSVACSLAVAGLVSVLSCGDSSTGPCCSSPGMVQSELPPLPGGGFLVLMEHVESYLNRHVLSAAQSMFWTQLWCWDLLGLRCCWRMRPSSPLGINETTVLWGAWENVTSSFTVQT